MKVLITGAGGFLGGALARRLLEQGVQLTTFTSRDCNLAEQDVLQRFNDRQFDEIIHLAAWTQAGDFCLHHPGEQWLINQKINTNVLDWWHTAQPQARLIFIGTSCAYDPSLPLVEENYLSGTPIASLFTYAMTKRMLYAGALALSQQFGHSFNSFVPSTLYGSGYHTDGRQMHFIFDLIRKILCGKYYQEPVVLWGDGSQMREVVFLEDFIDALLAANNRVTNTLVNIGAGEECTIKEFARRISEIVGFDASKIKYDTTKYVGARSKCLSINKLLSLNLPLRPRSLDEGLEATIKWFLEAKAF